MLPFFRSFQGRLLAFGMALPLTAGAIVPFTAEGIGYYALPLIAGICLTFVAIGLSLDDYPGAALTWVLTLPVALFLYLLLVGIVAPLAHGVAYPMAAVACALFAIAARPGLPAAAKVETRVPRVA